MNKTITLLVGGALVALVAQAAVPANRFTASEDVVADSLSQRTWQKGIASSDLTWEAAQQYCESLELGGYDDWRLPSLKELQTIVDERKGGLPNEFATTAAAEGGYFWSSTTYPGGEWTWTVHFGLNASLGRPDHPARVRCVR